MSRHITTGIDIGSYQVKVVIAEADNSAAGKRPKILGTGISESRGIRHGYVINTGDAVKSVRRAIDQAEKSSGIRIKNAYLSAGGVGLESSTSSATIPLVRGVVTEADIDRVASACEQNLPAGEKSNRKVIHKVAISYAIDGETVYGEPLGMKGKKLEAKVLFISYIERHLNDLVEVMTDAGIEILDVVAAPIAASLVTLSKAQKVAGVVLANIGSETVSIIVYENNIPLSLEVFPVGSNSITHGIALGLRIPIEEAENVKKGSLSENEFSRKKLDDIISSRLSDIFDLIEGHLKKINRNGLLPAGIVITGGGSGIATIDDIARAALKLPARVAIIGNKDIARDASWSVAYGLCILGLSNEENDTSGIKVVKITGGGIVKWFKQFLP